MARTRTLFALGGFLLAVLAVASVSVDGQDANERVLIRGAQPYTQIETAVAQAGGTITHRFSKIEAVAADVPATTRRHCDSCAVSYRPVR